MGCFIGCLSGEKDHKRRKRRTKPANPPQVHRNKVQNVQQENVTTAEENIIETPPNNLVLELQNKPAEDEQPSPIPKKRVTFNSNITIYEHVPIHESIISLPEECSKKIGRENRDDFNTTSPSSHSPFGDDLSVISTVGSYPPYHRYHNARDTDDEYEEYYNDSDLDDFDDEDDYDDYDDSFLASSMESRTENHSVQEINSVLKPIENITQWKAAKSKGTHFFKAKENSTANFEAARVSFSQELTLGQDFFGFKSKSDRVKNENREIGVDASLSNWLVCPQKNV